MVVYLKLNKENSFNNDCKVTFYTIFLIAKLTGLATLNSLSSLSLSLLQLSTHCLLCDWSKLTLFSLTPRHSLPPSFSQKFVIHTHKRIHTFNILNARPGGLVPGLTFCTVHHLGCNCWALGKVLGPFSEFAHPTLLISFNIFNYRRRITRDSLESSREVSRWQRVGCLAMLHLRRAVPLDPQISSWGEHTPYHWRVSEQSVRAFTGREEEKW